MIPKERKFKDKKVTINGSEYMFSELSEQEQQIYDAGDAHGYQECASYYSIAIFSLGIILVILALTGQLK